MDDFDRWNSENDTDDTRIWQQHPQLVNRQSENAEDREDESLENREDFDALDDAEDEEDLPGSNEIPLSPNPDREPDIPL